MQPAGVSVRVGVIIGAFAAFSQEAFIWECLKLLTNGILPVWDHEVQQNVPDGRPSSGEGQGAEFGESFSLSVPPLL